MATERKRKRLIDEYRFPGFEPRDDIRGIFGDPLARVIPLVRRSKKRSARTAGERTRVGTTARPVAPETSPAPTRGFTSNSKCGACAATALAK